MEVEVVINNEQPQQQQNNKKRKRRRPNKEKIVPKLPHENGETKVEEEDVEIEYVIEKPEIAFDDPSIQAAIERLSRLVPEPKVYNNKVTEEETKPDEVDEATLKVSQLEKSKKLQKKLLRPSVAHLKQITTRPAVVEVHDVTSSDPELLVYLKARRNAVTVPRHWSTSTKFLAGKNRADKKPYTLPEYIAQTGIAKLREASDDSKDSIQKRQRERARPKLGRLDIDYQVLHDAFFKYQTKPKLSRHGDLYHEGKEFEKDFSKFIPGQLSDELKRALGMPTEPGSNHPPPWLFNMQRIGPPPSYPTYQFPGVNSPIPVGSHYGQHSGGWGKPPLDERGRGLWGDVMGLSSNSSNFVVKEEPVTTLWGDFSIQDEEEDSNKRARYEDDEEEEAEEEVAEKDADNNNNQTEEASQTASIAAAGVLELLENELSTKKPVKKEPEPVIDLRKKPLPTSAHRVLEKQQQQQSIVGTNQVFGASHKYTSDVSISIAPDELKDDGKIDQADLAKKYEDERSRTKQAVGLAPGAGSLDVQAEFELQMKKKEQASKKPAKKDKFKF